VTDVRAIYLTDAVKHFKWTERGQVCHPHSASIVDSASARRGGKD